MSGALFDGFGAPISNETAVSFDGADGEAVTNPHCRQLMGVEDGPNDASSRDDAPLTVDLTYAASGEGRAISDVHLAHLVAVADVDGRIAFFGQSREPIEAAIDQVLGMSGGGRCMNALSPVDRIRLARVLGMLGSFHQGERDAAGLAAHRIVCGAGLSWDDLLRPALAAGQEPPRHRQTTGEAAIAADLRFCTRYFAHLTDWERNFVNSVSGRCKISEKQAAILRQAADKLRSRGFS